MSPEPWKAFREHVHARLNAIDRKRCEPVDENRMAHICPVCRADVPECLVVVFHGEAARAEVHCTLGCPPRKVADALELGLDDRGRLVPRVDEDQGPRERLRILDVEEMLAKPPPPVPWVVEPLLADGCVTMLAGREGRGKSMLALALAAAIGRGEQLLDVAGMSVGLGGHVVYVDAENGPTEAHRRVHGLEAQAEKLTYVEADGFDLKTHLGELEALVGEHEPRLLVLDSLRALAPQLDENDSLQVEAALRPVVRLTQRLHISTLLLHHAARMSGEYRGSTAIGAAVELGFTLSRVEEDPEAATRRKLGCWKSRPAAEPKARWLTIKPTQDGGIMLREAAPYEPARLTPVTDTLEEQLRAVIESWSGEVALKGVPHHSPSWTRADLARAVGRDPKDWSVKRAVDRLEEDGLIHRNGGRRYERSEPDGTGS